MIAEVYLNNFNSNFDYKRYLIPGGYPVMIGESLFGPEDYQNLRRKYGITCVINTQLECTDRGKLLDENLLQIGVADDGTPIPAQYILDMIKFVSEKLADKRKTHRFYVHCKTGYFVSPAFAYAILRGIYKITSEQALKIIQKVHADYGDHPNQRSYLNSVDSYINS